MALENAKTGEYLVITDIIDSHSIVVTFYQNKFIRDKEKDGTLGKYDRIYSEFRSVEIDMTQEANGGKSIYDNNKTAAYEALKKTEEFSQTIDGQEGSEPLWQDD